MREVCCEGEQRCIGGHGRRGATAQRLRVDMDAPSGETAGQPGLSWADVSYEGEVENEICVAVVGCEAGPVARLLFQESYDVRGSQNAFPFALSSDSTATLPGIAPQSAESATSTPCASCCWMMF